MEAFAIRNKVTGEWWYHAYQCKAWAEYAFFEKFRVKIEDKPEYEIVRLVPEERN